MDFSEHFLNIVQFDFSAARIRKYPNLEDMFLINPICLVAALHSGLFSAGLRTDTYSFFRSLQRFRGSCM